MIEEAAPRIQLVLNDGTNAQEVVDTINAWRVIAPIANFISVTDNAGTVEVRQSMFGTPSVTMSIPPGDYAVLTGDSAIAAVTATQRAARYGLAL